MIDGDSDAVILLLMVMGQRAAVAGDGDDEDQGRAANSFAETHAVSWCKEIHVDPVIHMEKPESPLRLDPCPSLFSWIKNVFINSSAFLGGLSSMFLGSTPHLYRLSYAVLRRRFAKALRSLSP